MDNICVPDYSYAVLAHHPAAIHHAPACGFQRRVDVFGAGFGFIHGGNMCQV